MMKPILGEAPQIKIEAIKKKTLDTSNNNARFKGLVEKLDSKNIKTQASIAEFKKKAIQASYDKLELMRDLATYEVSVADELSINQRMNMLKLKVNEKLSLLQ